MAQASPTTDTFLTGITKSIHHLTLGKIDLRPTALNSGFIYSEPSDPADQFLSGVAFARPVVTGERRYCSAVACAIPRKGMVCSAAILTKQSPTEGVSQADSANSTLSGSGNSRQNPISADSAQVTTEQIGATPATAGWRDRCPQNGNFEQENCQSGQLADSPVRSVSDSRFSGYVEESTSVRTSLTKMALDLWNDSPRTLLLGTGLGGAGPSLYEKFPNELGTKKQIVQNEYASLLLEFGLIGIAVVLTSIILILKTIKVNKKESPWLLTLLFAYMITLFFFSGLPNALHIYLLPAYAVFFIRRNQTETKPTSLPY